MSNIFKNYSFKNANQIWTFLQKKDAHTLKKNYVQENHSKISIELSQKGFWNQTKLWS